MKTIIFDFDGTIADSLGLVIEIYRELTNDTRKFTEEEYEEFRKLSARQVARAIGVSWWRVPLLLRKGRKIMRQRLGEVEVFDGLPEVIKELHGEGYNLQIVSSNSASNVRKFLKTHKLDEYFSSIRGDVGLFGKAKVLKQIIKKGNLNKNDTYYIGDEARDIVAAKKAGVKMVAVEWGYNHKNLLEMLLPYAMADSPKMLLKILSEKANQ